ncbi:hypothetical protein HanXRQr2_Chr14g0622501 [Helianthus annuus]|uniref:Uncharacterized protein n=1 Tax=Helianthus annuus TaxID=4232 RepID=A0A9K3E778_HELAN|nr:hypothetical protein HanXRQr2_Chr14g0622501 [Helianthus annuus]
MILSAYIYKYVLIIIIIVFKKKKKILQLLSSFVEQLAHLPSPFANLKSLKIHPERERLKVREHKRVEMSAEVRSYLLDGSPGATFTMVSREDIKSMKKLAENLRTVRIARAGES